MKIKSFYTLAQSCHSTKEPQATRYQSLYCGERILWKTEHFASDSMRCEERKGTFKEENSKIYNADKRWMGQEYVTMAGNTPES